MTDKTIPKLLNVEDEESDEETLTVPLGSDIAERATLLVSSPPEDSATSDSKIAHPKSISLPAIPAVAQEPIRHQDATRVSPTTITNSADYSETQKVLPSNSAPPTEVSALPLENPDLLELGSEDFQSLTSQESTHEQHEGAQVAVALPPQEDVQDEDEIAVPLDANVAPPKNVAISEVRVSKTYTNIPIEDNLVEGVAIQRWTVKPLSEPEPLPESTPETTLTPQADSTATGSDTASGEAEAGQTSNWDAVVSEQDKDEIGSSDALLASHYLAGASQQLEILMQYREKFDGEDKRNFQADAMSLKLKLERARALLNPTDVE